MTQTVLVLDTAVAENGPEYEFDEKVLILDKPFRFQLSLGVGDTVVVKGRNNEAQDYEILHTFVDEVPVDIYVSRFLQVSRTVDGASSPTSIVTMLNLFERDNALEDHV